MREYRENGKRALVESAFFYIYKGINSDFLSLKIV